MRKACKFVVVLAEGGSYYKEYNSYCIDYNDAVAQISEIYSEGVKVIGFRFV